MINSEYLKKLNNSQKEAVLYLNGPLLIVAGAGSGKTKVLTSRIAHIIKEKKAYPNQILAVTFTNKAAKEIGDWFFKKRSNYNKDIDYGDIFLMERDQKLKNLLMDKKANLEGRLVSLEYYLQSLQNVVSIISNDYKSVN